MAYKKKNLTAEERSEIYRRNAAKRKTFGRQKGSLNEVKKPKRETHSMTIPLGSYWVIRRFAAKHQLSIYNALELITESLCARDPSLRV